MPLQATSGAASYDAFGGGVASVPQYIEDVFSTFLYTGNGSTQTITNGIDLSTKGGLVWTKDRKSAISNELTDTVRGAGLRLISNTTSAQGGAGSSDTTSFTTTGFGLTYNNAGGNLTGENYVSWTFREQPKFFDIVTWTGTGANRTIAHALNSEVGFIVVKRTDASSTWVDYHRGFPSANYYSQFGTTGASYYSDSTVWNDTAPTSSVFSLGSSSLVNASGGTYVAYLFAHNAGGFGLNGTDNVIVCGTADTAWSEITVDCGFEPQFVMARVYERTGPWRIFDNMRGVAVNGNDAMLRVDQDYAEDVTTDFIYFTSTGFVAKSELVYSGKLFYIAIRRGPMKVPTSGTSVFDIITRAGTAAVATVSGLTTRPDLIVSKTRNTSVSAGWYDRLRGKNLDLTSSYTDAEYNESSPTNLNSVTAFNNNSYSLGADQFQGSINTSSGTNYVNWIFQRAPSFFDEVCYTGTGVARTVTHNLAVAPEIIIVKSRNGGAESWRVYYGVNQSMRLELSSAGATAGPVLWNDTAPTASVFSVGTSTNTNGSGYTYVAYLFATCAGVSKVGTYTGNGTTQTVDCGLTAGARFVLIKRTDASGDWYVYDTARGMTTLTDPYSLLNTTAAETATLGSVTTVSTGFALNSTILAAINVSGGTYIFLAIA